MQIFVYILQNVFNSNLCLSGVPGTTYFQMGVRGQLHYFWGSLTTWKCLFENHWTVRIYKTFVESYSGLDGLIFHVEYVCQVKSVLPSWQRCRGWGRKGSWSVRKQQEVPPPPPPPWCPAGAPWPSATSSSLWRWSLCTPHATAQVLPQHNIWLFLSMYWDRNSVGQYYLGE